MFVKIIVISASICTGPDAQYPNRNTCLTYCKQFPPGTWDDMTGNTLGCRVYHTLAAKLTGDKTHCKHGGITGEDVCGTWCDVYCQLSETYCLGNNQLYKSNSECMTACSQFSANSTSGVQEGNSVQCRIYHLGLAGQSSALANTHCNYASSFGGFKCSFGGAVRLEGMIIMIVMIFALLFF